MAVPLWTQNYCPFSVCAHSVLCPLGWPVTLQVESRAQGWPGAGHMARPGHQHSRQGLSRGGFLPPVQLRAQLGQSFICSPPPLTPSLPRLQGQADPEHKARALYVEWRTDAWQTRPLFCWSGGALRSQGPDEEGVAARGAGSWAYTMGHSRSPGADSRCVLKESPYTPSLARSPLPCPTGASPDPLIQQSTTCRRNPLPHPVLTAQTVAGVLAVGTHDKESGKHRHEYKTE